MQITASPFANQPHWAPVFVEHHRFDELIRHAPRVGGLYRLGGARGVDAFSRRHGAVGPLASLPTLIAVHRVVASDDGGEFGPRLAPQALRIATDEAQTRAGRRIPPVRESVREDSLDPDFSPQSRQRHPVVLKTVHAAVRNQTEDVQGAASRPGFLDVLDERREFEEIVALDRAVDANDDLIHHPARAEIEMPHFGIAHLPVRKPHGAPGGEEAGMGTVREQGIHGRGIGQCDGVMGALIG